MDRRGHPELLDAELHEGDDKPIPRQSLLCPEWKEIPLDTLAWGKGYARNILEQLTLIGQGLIIGGGRYAEWVDEQAKGATYYIRRRGSNYDCDVCEGLANKPIPIEVPFEYSHARCMCYPEFHYEPMPL